MTSEEYDEWIRLREAVFDGRQSADVARRYYRKKADQFRKIELGMNVGQLTAQASGVAALFAQVPGLALVLGIIAAVLTILAATHRNGDRRAEHLIAARSTGKSYATWDKLWREISSTPTWGTALEKRIVAATSVDVETENSMTEERDQKLWTAMEKAAVRAMDPRELAPEQPSWVAELEARRVGILREGS